MGTKSGVCYFIYLFLLYYIKDEWRDGRRGLQVELVSSLLNHMGTNSGIGTMLFLSFSFCYCRVYLALEHIISTFYVFVIRMR